MHHEHPRLTFGRMQNPVRGFLHGSAAVASVVGSVVLWRRGAPPHQFALLVFTVAMVGLYTVSSLYHSVPWAAAGKARMQRVDHSMIYVLVAATYTPITWVVLDGWLRTAVLCMAWGIALVGILQKALLPRVSESFAIAMTTIQGWLALPLFLPLAQRLPWPAMLLMGLGGVLYTVGMVCLVTERPRLWPRVFSYHETFHVCVIAGSTAHYAMMFAYVARFGVG
jgi:hemolysin III